jgi:CTP synthase (UTP-ammonia lyase)
MPFVEAFRQFQFKVKRENFCNVHVSLVPRPSATGKHLFRKLTCSFLIEEFIFGRQLLLQNM